MTSIKIAATPQVRALVMLVVVLPAWLLNGLLRECGREVEIRIEVSEA